MDINKQIRRYRNNELTPKELIELREKVNSMSDDELMEAMLEDLPQEEPVLNQGIEIRIQRVSQKLNRKINKELEIEDNLEESFQENRNNVHENNLLVTVLKGSENIDDQLSGNKPNSPEAHNLWQVFSRLAAVLIIPLICVIFWQLYTKGPKSYENAVIISTLTGQKASVTLPDGSEVSLNYESSLKYSTESFNKDSREILFEGEAYFNIIKDQGHPFIIKTPDIQVKVLGTTFNLLARETDEKGEVLLIEGKVELSSFHSDQVVIMNSNTRASIDLATGEIALDSVSRPEVPWQNGYISFSNKTLKNVIQALSSNYNRKITIDDSDVFEEHFSGYVPSDDLDMALQIIGDIFNLKIDKKAGVYYLSKISNRNKK